jgi:hypothetical protein
MQRINTAYFYRLAQKLIPLKSLKVGSTILDEYGVLYGAEEELRTFLSSSLIAPSTSYASCREIFDFINRLTSDFNREDPAISWFEAQQLSEYVNKFEIALQADFGVRDTFIVSVKRAYSTTLLVESGQSMVSAMSFTRFPGLHKDLHDAGRCVGFELPTAAAFHLFRAVEAAVHDYGVFVRKKSFSDGEKRGGLGSYANCLKEKTLAVDLRITGAIEHIASLYRNPTMHPEMHLSNEEVIGTLNIAISVIDLVALDWQRREDTPQKPLSEVLPDDTKIELLTDGAELSAGLIPRPALLPSQRASNAKTPKRRVAKPGQETPSKA